MSKVYEYYESRHEICGECGEQVPEWSFISCVCCCNEEDE